MSNYILPVLVTYGFGISMRYTGIRRDEVASHNRLGNPTPTKDYASVQRAFTISKSKCYNQSEALNELSNYKLSVLVTYGFGISIKSGYCAFVQSRAMCLGLPSTTAR